MAKVSKAAPKKGGEKAKKFAGIDNPKDFGAVNEFMSQFGNDDTASLVDDYEETEPTDWIHSGHYLFNAHISGSLLKGYPVGKVVTIPGDPKTGKSYLLMNGFREAQKKGYFIRLWETENAPDKNRFIKQGVDPKQIRISQPETVAQIIVEFTQLTETLLKMKKEGKELPKIAVAIDSLTVLNSQKQYDDALEGNIKADMGTVAKDIIQLFNMMTVRCGKLGILWLNTMHVYEKEVKGYQNRVKTPSGGTGPMYMSSVVPMLTKKYLTELDSEGNYTRHGVMVTSTIFESRFSQHHNIDMYINFEKGMNEFLGLQDYVGWDICGIDRGKVTDFVDVAYEMFTKKMVTYDTIVGHVFNLTGLKKMLTESKFEFIRFSLDKMIEEGYIANNDGETFQFTKKILKKFEEVSLKKDGSDKVWKYKYKTGEIQIAVPNASSPNWAIKHLGRAVSTQELFTPEVFTLDVLKMIDEKKIIPKFKLSDQSSASSADEAAAEENSIEDLLTANV